MTTSEAPPALAPEAETPEPETPVGERRIAAVLLALTFLFALIAQTLLFHTSAAIGGDISYHRGVGLTMSAGSFSGEGPIHGILSYYGGLYPLGFGWGSRLLGVPFDRLVSVVSWPFVLTLPLALWWLGRGMWPRKALEPAVFVFLGTVASSLALDNKSMWVNSVLPSGTNMWPVYPRDIALVIFIVALALVMRDYARWRAPVAGLLAGAAICIQAQLGIYCIGIVGALLLWRSWPDRKILRGIVDAVVVGVVAVVVSAWWWWPRFDEVTKTHRVLLKSFPGLSAPDASIAGYFVALGAVGILAFPGAYLAFRRGRRLEQFAAVWFLTLTAFALVGPIFGDIGLITPRRAWFLAALPLVICAAIAATALIRWGPSIVMVTALIAVIVIPSASEAWQTRDLVSDKWATPSGTDLLSQSQWKTANAQLRDKTIDDGSLVVVAPDGDGVNIWEATGAQPFSLWLPGWVKIGFDPAQVTKYSYLDRVHMQTAAFAKGLPGICKLTKRVGAKAIVLRRDGHLLGTYDDSPGAPYRVDPKDRSKKTITRNVATATKYLDRNAFDLLVLFPGGELPIPWSNRKVRRVDVVLNQSRPKHPMKLVLGTGGVIEPRLHRLGKQVVLSFDTPYGVFPGSKFVASTEVIISRIIGYQPAKDLPGPTHGPVVLDPARVCRNLG